MNQARMAPRKNAARVAAKSKAYKPKDLPLIVRLIEAGNDDFDVAHVLDIPVEDLLHAATKDQALQKVLDSREEIGLWDEERNMKIARQLAARGYSEAELSDALRASPRTILLWELEYPHFAAALKMTDEVKLRYVEQTLLRMATGFAFEDNKLVDTKSGVKKIRQKKVVSPDERAARVFLHAHKPDLYGANAKPTCTTDDLGELFKELAEQGVGSVPIAHKDAG